MMYGMDAKTAVHTAAAKLEWPGHSSKDGGLPRGSHEEAAERRVLAPCSLMLFSGKPQGDNSAGGRLRILARMSSYGALLVIDARGNACAGSTLAIPSPTIYIVG
jgi:hypothetical protein